MFALPFVVLALLAVYDPALQTMHADVDVLVYFPAPQAVHCFPPAAARVSVMEPGGQVEQPLAPACEYCPGVQSVHAVIGEAAVIADPRFFPAWHAVHLPLSPTLSQNVPGGHWLHTGVPHPALLEFVQVGVPLYPSSQRQTPLTLVALVSQGAERLSTQGSAVFPAE